MIKSEPDRKRSKDLGIDLKTIKLFEKIAKAGAPAPIMTVSQWADAERRLSAESSAEAGRWNTDRAPYQREILDAVNNPECEEVVIMSSAQVGKTELRCQWSNFTQHAREKRNPSRAQRERKIMKLTEEGIRCIKQS